MLPNGCAAWHRTQFFLFLDSAGTNTHWLFTRNSDTQWILLNQRRVESVQLTNDPSERDQIDSGRLHPASRASGRVPLPLYWPRRCWRTAFPRTQPPAKGRATRRGGFWTWRRKKGKGEMQKGLRRKSYSQWWASPTLSERRARRPSWRSGRGGRPASARRCPPASRSIWRPGGSPAGGDGRG